MLVDAHVNFSHKDLINQVDLIIQEARENEINRLLAVNSNLYDFEKDLNLVNKYSFIDLSIGHHPCICTEIDLDKFEEILETNLLNNNGKIKVVGETGLDYSYDVPHINQIKSLELHIEKAIKFKLPILIHVRDAFDDLIDILSKHRRDLSNILIHCFTGDDNQAEKLIDLDCYFSITGIMTFKNAEKLRNTIKKLPIEKIFFETDSPYLTPIPMRGKVNNPSYLRHIVEFYCQLTNQEFAKIADISTKNYERFLSCQS